MNLASQAFVLTACLTGAAMAATSGHEVTVSTETMTRTEVSFTSLESAIYMWVCANPGSDAFDVADHFGIDDEMAVTTMRSLFTKGLLERV